MTINFKESFIISQNQNINLYKKYINPGLSKAFTIFGYNSLDIKKAKNSFIYLSPFTAFFSFRFSIFFSKVERILLKFLPGFLLFIEIEKK